MSQTSNPIYLPVIVGPTAVGKTAVAIRIGEIFNGEIISADSRQVYAGMEIGSGAPTPEEVNRVPHHIVGILEPEERLSAGEFARIANAIITDIMHRGKIPILVGGSGLYVKALIDGLSPIPPVDAEIRDEIGAEIAERGMKEMIDELTKFDPEYAEIIGVNDEKRLIRAFEVWRTTGRTFTSWHRESDYQTLYTPLMFGLARPRQELVEIIEQRIKSMIKAGWKSEVRKLSDRFGGYENIPLTVTEGLGYGEIISYLKGEITLDEAIARILILTRQFAKRQMTWFRADKRVKWLELSGDKATDGWVSWLQEELKAVLTVNSETRN